MKNKLTLVALGIPLLMLVISIIAFVINTRIAEGKPEITGLSPQIVSSGEKLTIMGNNFGDKKESSRVYLSSLDLLSKYILSWSDKAIEIVIPEKADSGLVSVETDRGTSEPVILVLEENVPFIGAGAYIPGLPFVETIDPQLGSAGAFVTITGDNFGNRKNNSSILFSSMLSKEKETLEGETVLVDFISVDDLSIVSWTNKEIRFYLPDSVTTGDVYVKTEAGYSNAVYFEQKLSTPTIELTDKRTYMMAQIVTASMADLQGSGPINLWITSPEPSISQRNIISLSDRTFESTRSCSSMDLYRIDDLNQNEDLQIRHNTIVDVYASRFIVDPSEVSGSYETGSPLYLKYTVATDLIPSRAERVAAVSRSVTRRKTGSFNKARAIYDYVLARLEYSDEISEWAPDLVIDTMIGDAKAYSLLFAALSRNAGIPSRPITGLLVNEAGEASPHWWVEFYLQGYGWFALDPALADKENSVEQYWGNIDNQHIAFSRGEKEIPRLFPHGNVINNAVHSYVTHNVETGNAINNLRLDWSDVKMTAIY